MMSCFKGVIPLLLTKTNSSTIKLILCEGTTRVIKPNCRRKNNIKAGEIMFQFPDCVVCHADSFFLGRRIPILSIHDRLVAGHTYFVLPLDRLPPPNATSSGGDNCGVLSAASLSFLGSPSPSSSPANARRAPLIKICSSSNNARLRDTNEDNANDCGKSPFEYIKDKDGRVYLIKVVPEFITRIITGGNNNGGGSSPSNNKLMICSTPELEKQYKQLVRAKDQQWSPKLETITEHKIRFSLSPCRFIGSLEWKQKEKPL